MLLRSPQIQDLYTQYNQDNLISLHPNFANMGKISALIFKEKLAFYPEGQDLNGLYFEKSRQENTKVSIDPLLIN